MVARERAEATRIEADFTGADCQLATFTGRVVLGGGGGLSLDAAARAVLAGARAAGRMKCVLAIVRDDPQTPGVGTVR